MRFTTLFLASFALVAASSFSASAEDAQATLPERKAGLWQMKTMMDEGNGPRDQTMKLCVDERMEKNTVEGSIAEHKSNCASYNIKASGGQTTVDSECIFNGRKVISTTNMSGDFKTEFQISITSTTTDPSTNNQSVVVKRTITQLGKYVGATCGDLKPGEAEASDGSRMLVQ